MNMLAKLAFNLRGSLNKPSNCDFVAGIKMGQQIPKIIHQTYYSKNLPHQIQTNINQLKNENPDWDFRLYDDQDIDDYIQSHFPQLFATYKKINPKYGAAKADFFRYLVMYKDGGIYLDIKSGLDKPLSAIIKNTDQYILSYWPRHYPKIMQGQHNGITNPIGEYQQWYIISVAGHPYLKSVINNVCSNIANYNPFFHDFGSWGVFNLTGPIAYTEAIYPILDQYSHRMEKDHIELGLIYCAIDPKNPYGGHHAIFQKKHYSSIEEPVVLQTKLKSALFYLCRPFIKYLKSKLKATL